MATTITTTATTATSIPSFLEYNIFTVTVGKNVAFVNQMGPEIAAAVSKILQGQSSKLVFRRATDTVTTYVVGAVAVGSQNTDVSMTSFYGNRNIPATVVLPLLNVTTLSNLTSIPIKDVRSDYIVSTSAPRTLTSSSGSSDGRSIWLPLAIVLAITLFILLLILVYCIVRMCRRRRSKTLAKETEVKMTAYHNAIRQGPSGPTQSFIPMNGTGPMQPTPRDMAYKSTLAETALQTPYYHPSQYDAAATPSLALSPPYTTVTTVGPSSTSTLAPPTSTTLPRAGLLPPLARPRSTVDPQPASPPVIAVRPAALEAWSPVASPGPSSSQFVPYNPEFQQPGLYIPAPLPSASQAPLPRPRSTVPLLTDHVAVYDATGRRGLAVPQGRGWHVVMPNSVPDDIAV